MASDSLFRQKAPGIMNYLMADFLLDLESAAAILGNLGHESGGFQFLQEKQPLIPGSAGGYGWAQWTGPRRREFEAYVSRNGFDPASDTANYKWLWNELKTSERAAIPAVQHAVGLDAKVRAFEAAFERAGIKSYESRLTWAERALDAYHANPGGTLQITDVPTQLPAKTGEVLDPIRNLPGQPLEPSQLIAVFVALLHQVMAVPEVRTVIEPLVTQMLGIKPAPPAVPVVPATTAKTDRPSVQLGFAGVIGSLIAMATGHLGTPLGMGTEPTVAGNVVPLVSALVGGVGLLGGGWAGLIGPALNMLSSILPKAKT